MSRKLHNTLMAVIASSSLLTLGLIAGAPVVPSLQAAVAPAVVDNLNQVPATPDAALGDDAPAATPPRAHGQAVRGNRQSVSMPFFSFVPRG